MNPTGFRYLDEPRRPIPFAHRGGATHPDILGLENTITAFRHAVRLGYRYLETDVHATSDGHLVAFHDDVLDRVSDQVGALADLTWTQVAEATVGGSEPVPAFADLFDAFPEARFNVDIKAAGAVEPLARFIEERDAHDRLLVGSFSRGSLNRFRRLTGGRVATSAHPGEVLVWLLSPSGRLADLLTRRQVSALQIPHRQRGVTVASRWLVRKAHAAGKHVHVWTIDDADEIRQLVRRGVDGVMTDRTDILKAVLMEMGAWEGDRGEPEV
ncbi:glycerophosphodiester phosphodiesterase [Nocardioides daejeonensis]|uniref:glycerophosphodiester phosphodiesterase n=1 Tax=Nocardioides daejeonensis TaxID=1046556 RepID=UPI000D74A9D5|nr:glycerophosphodiester phosphodiesterase [Nocardioides daejeonensis]